MFRIIYISLIIYLALPQLLKCNLNGYILIADSTRIIFTDQADTLTCVDTDSKKVIWKSAKTFPVSSKYICYDNKALIITEQFISEINKSDGHENWHDILDFIPACKPVYSDGKLIFRTAAKIYCYDLSDKEIKWEYNCQSDLRVQPDIDSGKIYIFDKQNKLHVLKVDSGELEFSEVFDYNIDIPVFTKKYMMIRDDKRFYLIGKDNRMIQKVYDNEINGFICYIPELNIIICESNVGMLSWFDIRRGLLMTLNTFIPKLYAKDFFGDQLLKITENPDETRTILLINMKTRKVTKKVVLVPDETILYYFLANNDIFYMSGSYKLKKFNPFLSDTELIYHPPK